MSKLKIFGQLLAALLCLGAAIALVVDVGLPVRSGNRGEKDKRLRFVAPEVGSLAPDFTLKRAQGSALSLEQVRAEVIIINFWATWCGPCRWEMRNLQLLHEEYPGELRILAVNLGESAAAVNRWVAANGLTFDALLDSENQAARSYQVRGAPTTFVLDRARRIRRIYFGTVSIPSLLKDIERLSGRA